MCYHNRSMCSVKCRTPCTTFFQVIFSVQREFFAQFRYNAFRMMEPEPKLS